MPLESLGQPFNPDEPGRKLREVRFEQEPEKEPQAREQYEHVKKLFCPNGEWFSDYGKDVTERHAPTISDLCILSLVEQELNTSSPESEKYQRKLARLENQTPLPYMLLVLRMIPKNPEYAQLMWKERIKNSYRYNEQEAQYYRVGEEGTGIGLAENMRLIFTHSFFEPEEARKKLVALKQRYGAGNNEEASWRSLGFHLTNYDLLSVLIESSCNMPSAIQYYDELKASSALDQETMLWDKLDSDLTGRRVYDLEDQLCDILFRIRLEKYRTASHALTSKQIIPEERNF